MQKLTDEYGTPWSVLAGDPARAAVLKLHRQGFQQVVLPRRFLMGLTPSTSTHQPRHLPPEGVSNETLLRRARLYDCLHTLENL